MSLEPEARKMRELNFSRKNVAQTDSVLSTVRRQAKITSSLRTTCLCRLCCPPTIHFDLSTSYSATGTGTCIHLLWHWNFITALILQSIYLFVLRYIKKQSVSPRMQEMINYGPAWEHLSVQMKYDMSDPTNLQRNNKSQMFGSIS